MNNNVYIKYNILAIKLLFIIYIKKYNQIKINII